MLWDGGEADVCGLAASAAVTPARKDGCGGETDEEEVGEMVGKGKRERENGQDGRRAKWQRCDNERVNGVRDERFAIER